MTLPSVTTAKVTSMSSIADSTSIVESMLDSLGSISETPITDPSTQIILEPNLQDSVDLTTASPTTSTTDASTNATSLSSIADSTSIVESMLNSLGSISETPITDPSTQIVLVPNLQDFVDLTTAL